MGFCIYFAAVNDIQLPVTILNNQIPKQNKYDRIYIRTKNIG